MSWRKLIAILAAACLPLAAQTVIHSSITGRVLDPAGAPVPNVKLTATVAPGGFEHQAATDDRGNCIYQFPRLTPGQARLIAEKDGFQRVVREGIAPAVGTPAVVDLRLEVGNLSTSVTVSGDAAVVQSTESNLGLLICTTPERRRSLVAVIVPGKLPVELVIPRNAFRAPAIYNADVSLAKRVAITERAAVRLELNAFNVFNRAHLGIPNSTLTSAFFGQITSTLPAMNPRQIQPGAKLTF